MRARMQLTGVARVRSELRQLADKVPESSRKAMRRSAEIIVREARINAPVMDGFLEQSIRIVKDYAGIRGRLQIDVIAGDMDFMSPVDGRFLNVDQYVTAIHENYSSYKPGYDTIKKRAIYGERVGERFLARAAKAEEPKLIQRTIQAVNRTIDEVMG